MAILQQFNISGVENAFDGALISSIGDSSFPSANIVSPSAQFWTGYYAWTRLSYDPEQDTVILTNSKEQSPTFQYLAAFGPDGRVNRVPITHVAFDAATLDPGAGDQELGVKGLVALHYPDSGGAFGFTYDPNTGKWYQKWWHYLLESDRYFSDTFGLGYGNNSPVSVVPRTIIGWILHQWTVADGGLGDRVLGDTIINTAAGFAFSPGLHRSPLGAVRFDDIVVMAYSDLNRVHSWISVRKLPATDDDPTSWRGTRKVPFGPPMLIAAMDIDKLIVVWWANAKSDSPLIYTIYIYDRPSQRLFLEDMGKVPTRFSYITPFHVGYGTYDMKRGHLILLSPNPDDLDTVVFDQFCHPGRATQITPASPLDPFLAGQETTFATGAQTGATIQGTGTITVNVTGTTPLKAPAVVNTNGVTGAGTFTIAFDSGLDTATLALTTSAFSVAVSSTFAQGQKFGVESLAILSTTTTFTLSQTLSATLPASAAKSVIILPRQGTLVSDAVGAGAARLLSYPTNALTTPVYYELNPQQWTNMGANPLTRPLYASRRTLTKTATVQFVGDPTDLDVREVWLGGGNDRIAMSVSFFANLYDYFANVPDIVNAGFITWEPRDLNSNAYAVFITSLTVGGKDGEIMLDHFYKAQQGWIHETVEMTIKLVGNA